MAGTRLWIQDNIPPGMRRGWWLFRHPWDGIGQPVYNFRLPRTIWFWCMLAVIAGVAVFEYKPVKDDWRHLLQAVECGLAGCKPVQPPPPARLTLQVTLDPVMLQAVYMLVGSAEAARNVAV